MKNGKEWKLNAEQSEVVHRANSSCHIFVVEAPPGSDFAAAAVAAKGAGLQLLLSTTNASVDAASAALAAIDLGDKRVVHLRTAEREAKRISVLSVLQNYASKKKKFEDLRNQFERARKSKKGASKLEKRRLNREIRMIKKQMRKVLGKAIKAFLSYPTSKIILGTVDMMLSRLEKPGAFQKVLKSCVSRVIVNGASQLTESALNALIFTFPSAQIILVSDSNRPTPFNYDENDLVSKMASRSATEVVRRSFNAPVIKLRGCFQDPLSDNVIATYRCNVPRSRHRELHYIDAHPSCHSTPH